jgi:hypothetical protein
MIASRASLVPLLAIAIGLGVGATDARADDVDRPAAAERCAIRLSIAFLGEGPSAELRATDDPQAAISSLLSAPSFRERFARFVNATHNREPGEYAAQDASYWMTLHVLERALPWRELFVGRFNVIEDEADDEKARVVDDPKGLGYFRSFPWLERYAGNEATGLRIASAYRIAQNTIGLRLSAVTNAPGVDISAKGRRNAPCATCHENGFYPLDRVAAVLTRRNDESDELTFDPPKGGPQTILDGTTVSNDAEVVTALVDSEAFRFAQCRLGFQVLYGRDENLCEGPVFDACMAEFTATGRIESALSAIASHPSFCQ